MHLHRFLGFGSLLITAMLAAGCASPSMNTTTGPLVIERQGSFYVGGREVKAAGTYDAVSTPAPANAGQSYWIDQMYVQYQVPVNARKLPIVLVHGGGGSGAVWETTPDGREGFQTIFLRRGFPVYLVDAPRGGRSGFPSFNGPIGKLDDNQQLIPSTSTRPGLQHAWSRWRLGPEHPQTFPEQAFPMEAVDAFMKAVRPTVSDDPEVISRALIALLDKIGPAIVVTHSNSGLWGWLAAARSPNVKAVVSYEPNFIWPRGEALQAPQGAVRSFSQPAGTQVSPQEFGMLAKIPVQVVFGDNIPTQQVRDQPADGRRLQVQDSRVFVDALNQRGGRASLLLLRDAGLRGNSHFMYQDRNNVQVADLLSAFLARNGLDGR
ncbi:MAG TPA: alpha/beta fold hydrolase [Ramlibacter sp.]|nr:alpha/beta fold hydrolase [Ramlibacter sp.]